MNKTKVLITAGLIVLASLIGLTSVASAQSVRTGDSVNIGAQNKVDGMVFLAGNTITIAGEVNGDVYCAGQTVSISGTVRGDVLCAGQTVIVSGSVDGSLRLAAQNVVLGGQVADSVTVGAQSFTTESTSSIGRDVLGGAEAVTLNGAIKRDLAIGATTLIVNQEVGRNIKGEVKNLRLTDSARVGGNIEYQSSNQPSIASSAQIGGSVTRTEPEKKPQKGLVAPLAFSFVVILYIFTALLLVIVALALLIPRVLDESATAAIQQPARTALIGFGASIAAPLLIMALLLSVIGIPLALLLIKVWLIVCILSGPFTGYAIGRIILKKSKSPLAIAIVGGSVLLLAYFIPIVGLVALFVAYIFGSGMVLTEVTKRLPKPSQKLN